MSRRARLFVFVLGFFACANALAQQSAGPAARKDAPKRPGAAEADPLAETRRASAISLVNALADDARTFREPHLRARTQARAADVLWETDKERARELFRRAWEAASAADRENERLTEAERRARAAARGSTAARELPSMRREVLRLAARRDHALGTEFLEALDESRQREAANAATATPAATVPPAAQRFNPDNPPPEMAQHLNLAGQLVEDGDVERAVQFAAPALYPVNTLGMNFLDVLRTRDAARADQLYSTLLPRAAGDPLSDANTVSLLSAYVLTPKLYITVQSNGAAHTRRWSADNTPPANLDPRLRTAFLNTAAQILLRPLAPPEQDQTSAGRTGAYVIITRLAPIFEQYGHPRAPLLRARQALLLQDTPERNRRPDDPLLTRGLVPEDPNRDRVQELLNQLERARDTNERDRLHFEAAMAALGRGSQRGGDEARARELAGKIEDVDTRRQLFAFIAYRAVEDAISDKRAEDALRHARSDELTRVQRAWGMTEAARLLAKEQPGAAVEALDAAAEEARRIDESSPDRLRALVAVATQLHRLDRGRAWDLMAEVAKASNALPEFSGEDGQMTVRVEFKGGGAMTTNSNVESFDLTGIFTALARDDFDRAAALAKTLKGESARAVATLAVARVALERKKEKESAAN